LAQASPAQTVDRAAEAESAFAASELWLKTDISGNYKTLLDLGQRNPLMRQVSAAGGTVIARPG